MNKYRVTLIALFALFWAAPHAAAQTEPLCIEPVCTKNTSEYMGKKRWNWSVFIDPRSRDLARIKCVEYTLHPTFPDPVRVVCEIGGISEPFALRSNGWGTFTIKIRVLMKNGTVKELWHELRFRS